MANRSPGEPERSGKSLIALFKMIPSDDSAKLWFEKVYWRGFPFCPLRGTENVQEGVKGSSKMPRCREKECGERFSLRVGTVRESYRISLQKWAIELKRDLNIGQKSAWILARCIRQLMDTGDKSALPFNRGGQS